MVNWQPFGDKSKKFLDRSVYDDAWITILEGSVRSSKTVTMIPKWLKYLATGPKGLKLITGVSKDTIYDNVLRDIFDTVGSNAYTYNKQSGDLVLFGQDIKVIGGKDEGSEKYLRGKTLAGAYVDEGTLLPENFFKQLLNRLSVKDAKLYMTTNPDTPSHYLYTGYITDQKQLDTGAVRVLHFELDDNPNLDEGYKERIRNAYQGLFYDRMILGLWVMGEGAIYSMMTEENFYDEELSPWILQTAQHDIAVDYGTQNATVFLHCIDDGTTLYIDREYYYSGRETGLPKTDTQLADDFETFKGSYPIFSAIVDPSAASFKAELNFRGVLVRDADNDVSDGIRMTSSALFQRIIKIHNRCKNLKREMQSYRWDMKLTDKGKEQPVKIADHGPDCLRYKVKTDIPAFRLNLDFR